LNLLEFAFARSVGNPRQVDDELALLARRLHLDGLSVVGEIDRTLLEEERLLMEYLDRKAIAPKPGAPKAAVAFAESLQAFQRGDIPTGWKLWKALGRPPRSSYEAMIVARAAIAMKDEHAEAAIPADASAAERHLLRGLALGAGDQRQRAEAVDELEQGFLASRTYPWVDRDTMPVALDLARRLGDRNPPVARKLAAALAEPFSVYGFDQERGATYVQLARSASDPALCVRAIDSLAPLFMNTVLYESRLDCYRQAGDPRQAEAELEFGRLLLFTMPFGADVPGPPGSMQPTPPPATPDNAPALAPGAAILPSVDASTDAQATTP
ncbi:MAG TPA: hypothetical protein VM580_34465, partial [Labilithrix sp.]|nr:hypothetical protein [Labilithrix sp.]